MVERGKVIGGSQWLTYLGQCFTESQTSTSFYKEMWSKKLGENSDENLKFFHHLDRYFSRFVVLMSAVFVLRGGSNQPWQSVDVVLVVFATVLPEWIVWGKNPIQTAKNPTKKSLIVFFFVRNAGTGDNDTVKCSGNTLWQCLLFTNGNRVTICDNKIQINRAIFGFFSKNLSK